MIKILITVVAAFIMHYVASRGRLISSVSLWIFCYALIFVVCPLINTSSTYANEKIIDYYSFLGSLSFFLGVTVAEGSSRGRKLPNSARQESYLAPSFGIALLGFVTMLFVSLAILVRQINITGILDILHGQSTSKYITLNSDVSSIYTFSVHLLVPCILAMWVSASTSKQRVLSVVSLITYVVLTLLFGFTRIFMICIIAMIVFHQLRNCTIGQQVFFSVIGLVFLTLTMVLMNFIRCFGLGNPISIEALLSFDYVLESTDFSASYYWFDRLLSSNVQLINPIVYLKPLFSLIPRSIWASKPLPLSLQVLMAIDPGLAATGYSTAGNSVLGEGYVVLGKMGLLIYPFVWGIICSTFDRRYQQRVAQGHDNATLNILYYVFATFIVVSAQRGDWSQYMTIVLYFYFFPLWAMSARVSCGRIGKNSACSEQRDSSIII